MNQRQFSVSFLGQDINAIYVTDKSTALKLLEGLMQKDCLFGIDTETMAKPQFKHRSDAALSAHLGQIRLLQVFDGRNSVIFDLLHIACNSIFISFLESKRFVAHNAIFDLQFFMQMGVKKMNIGCTYLVAKLLFHASYPTDEGLSASLQALTEQMFKVDMNKAMQKSDWSVPDLTFEQIEYASLDAVCVLKLAEKLAPGIEKLGLTRIYKLSKAAQHPIARMQLNGILLDVKRHREKISEWRAALYAAKKHLLKITGLDEITGHKLSGWLDGNLPPHVRRIWPETETGKLSTDAHTFADFSFLPIVAPFSDYQRLEKLTSTYGNRLIDQINPATGRLHAQYKICGARTGRLSSSSPNLQNLPRDNDIRKNFIPTSKNVFLCADYSQVELRVAAELSRDTSMLKAYEQGIDLHALTASKVSHKPISEVTKSDRQFAKAINFGFLFGLGARKFSHYAKKSYKVDVTEDEATEAVEVFRETYAGYREWQLEQATRAHSTLTCRTPCGKLRKLPADNTYGNSMNHPVQGGAAEIMLYALVRLDRELGNKGKLVNCVHDELLIECEPAHKKECSSKLEDCMVQAFLDVFPNGITRGLVETKSGLSWGECKQ